MSTTLIPPTFYVVQSRGRPARVSPTIPEAAGAIVMLGSRAAVVSALTGRRSRRLTNGELRELERHVRARRPFAVGRAWRTDFERGDDDPVG